MTPEPRTPLDAPDERPRLARAWVGAALLLATIAGLAFVAWRIDPADAARTRDALTTLGPARFLAYCAWSLGVYGLLGAAWLAVMPGETTNRLPLLVWARMVREATSDLLPFSQLGGVVLGTRLVVQRGIVEARVYASFTADLGTELAAQLALTVAALWWLSVAPVTGPGWSAVSGVPAIVAAALLLAVLVLGQRGLIATAPAIARRLLPRSAAVTERTMAELRRIHAGRSRLATGLVLNVAAWGVSAAGAWVVLALLRVDAPLGKIAAIEMLVFAVRGVAFLVPAGLVVQEASYALLFPVFGLPLESAILLALLKRTRDLAVGLPVVVAWQWGEALRLRRAVAGGAPRRRMV